MKKRIHKSFLSIVLRAGSDLSWIFRSHPISFYHYLWKYRGFRWAFELFPQYLSEKLFCLHYFDFFSVLFFDRKDNHFSLLPLRIVWSSWIFSICSGLKPSSERVFCSTLDKEGFVTNLSPTILSQISVGKTPGPYFFCRVLRISINSAVFFCWVYLKKLILEKLFFFFLGFFFNKLSFGFIVFTVSSSLSKHFNKSS